MVGLVRMSLSTETDPVDEHRERLAQKTEECLGYSVLSREIGRNQRPLTTFFRALRGLGLAPFTRESVNAYKDKMRYGPTTRWLRKHEKSTKGSFGLAYIICAILLFGGIFWGWQLSAFGGGTLALVICFNILFRLIINTRTFSWRTIRINDYEKFIPEFALQTAVDIKEKCPEAIFFVEECVASEDNEFRLLLDPFLVAEVGGNKFYLEVWSEPGFGGQREI